MMSNFPKMATPMLKRAKSKMEKNLKRKKTKTAENGEAPAKKAKTDGNNDVVKLPESRMSDELPNRKVGSMFIDEYE